jgi:hypothetical protein
MPQWHHRTLKHSGDGVSAVRPVAQLTLLCQLVSNTVTVNFQANEILKIQEAISSSSRSPG